MAFLQYMKDTFFDRLLNYYHINEEQYQELTGVVTIDSFAYGRGFKDMPLAVSIVKEAINNKDKIFIYGDYDADGIMSTSIMVKTLLKLGVIPEFYIPNRYNDGYGITLAKAKEVVGNGVKLVITVDNGVSAFEPIEYLKDNDVKVIIADHHTIGETLPPADAVLHPTYSGFGDIASSAGFVSFMFSWALLGEFDKYLATLASISLVSDMMPLVEYNRNLLRLMFEEYKDGEYYAIDLLKEGAKFDENAIGMKIAPKINALGRMLDNDQINYIVRYFVTPDKSKIDRLYKWITSVNEERKIVSKEAVDNLPKIDEREKAIVVELDVKEGLIGLAANHLCNEYHKPTIVFTKEKENDVLKGSARTPEGFNVVEAFAACSDLTLTSGGHALAGGCSINKNDFESFKKIFNKFAEDNPIKEVVEDDIQIGLTEINEENYRILQSFSPFGEGWKTPNLCVKHIKTNSLMYSRSGEHIMTYLGQSSKLTGFGFSKEMVSEYSYIDVYGKMTSSVYRGQESIDFYIRKIKESN